METRSMRPQFCTKVIDACYSELVDLLESMPDDEKQQGLCGFSIDYGVDGENQEVSYADRAARLVYLLRYFFSYSHEYYQMYRDALKLMGPRDEMTVCSLGCGAEVDRWSALRALDSDDAAAWKPRTPLRYLGFDVVDWGREAALLWDGDGYDPDKTEWKRGAEGFAELVASGSCKPDIICFPKSAMEIRSDRETWGKVLQAIGSLKTDEFCIAISRSQSYYRVPFFDNLETQSNVEDNMVGTTMRALIMELVVAAQVAGFGQLEMKISDVLTHDKDDEGAEPYRWSRWAAGRQFFERVYDNQRDKITSLHAYCPHWKDGEGCCKPEPPDGWRDLKHDNICRKADRSPTSIKYCPAENGKPASYRSCYVILHFKKAPRSKE